MPYHTDTDDYLSRLALAGGTISPYNTDLLDTKIRYAYAYGLRGSTDYLKYWLCLNLTESFTGCLVPVYDDGVGNAINGGFDTTDWSASLGLKGNGVDKYLDTNYNPATSLGTFSFGGRSDFHFGVWRTNFFLSTLDYRTHGGLQFGAGAANNLYFPMGSIASDENYIELWRTQTLYEAPAYTGEFLMVNAVARDNIRLIGNSSLLAQNTTDSATINNPNYPFILFAGYHYIDDYFYGHTDISMSNFTFGFGLSPAQETALYTMLNMSSPYYALPLMLLAC